LLSAGASAAEDYPSRPIRIIDGFAAGGNTDVLARTIGQKLYEAWGQPVIVDNRPGAAGNVGAEIVARAAPSGHTLLMGWTTTIAISKTLYPKLTFDAARDLAPVGLAASSLLVLLAHPSVPASSVQDLIALAKSRPGQLNYASAGAGSGTHLAGELFKMRAGLNIVHVAYKGGAPAAAAIAAGESQIGFASLAASQPLLKAGRVKGIAVTAPQRSNALPNVPTIAESGLPGFDLTTWYGLFAPVGTPSGVVARLNTEVTRILKMPEVVERLRNLGLEARTSTPSELASIFGREIALYARVIRDADIKSE
jgi:tripartite-type tricarboxylate transporter receptor subunit TctC